MFRGFLSGFIVLVLIIAFILYGYGTKTISDISTESKDAATSSHAADIPAIKQWISYTPPSKKFSAKFPTMPQHATDRSTDSKTKEPKQYDMYVSEAYGKVYMIGVISFLKEDKIKDDEATLKSTIDDMVSSNPENKLEKVQFDTFNGQKAARFTIANGSYTILGRAFINKNDLYVLSAVSKNAPEESQKDFDYFVNSIHLENEPSKLIEYPKTTSIEG